MDNKVRKYLDHYEAELYTSYTDEGNCSFHIYREDTADGYEVFIAKYKADNNINIMDDVYYYQHDLTNIVIEKIITWKMKSQRIMKKNQKNGRTKMLRKNITSIGEVYKLRKVVERIEKLLNKIIDENKK